MVHPEGGGDLDGGGGGRGGEGLGGGGRGLLGRDRGGTGEWNTHHSYTLRGAGIGESGREGGRFRTYRSYTLGSGPLILHAWPQDSSTVQ